MITVRFSQAATFITQTGITITNITTGDAFGIATVDGNATELLTYNGAWGVADPVFGDEVVWDYDGLGDYIDGDAQPMDAHSLVLTNCTFAELEILSSRVYQEEVPGVGGRIVRLTQIEVVFNQRVTSSSAAGVSTTVHGSAQVPALIMGSGTDRLIYQIARAIFRHDVTWAYEAALGDITAVNSGLPLGDVGASVITNEMPEFTVHDYDALAPDANTDTQFDNDETRHDEV